MARLSGTEPDPATPAPGSLPLWPLALLAALLPAVAALLALRLAVLAVVLVLLGLVNATLAALFGEPLKGRIENVTEWWGALVFVLGFGALAAVWWHAGLRVTIGSAPR